MKQKGKLKCSLSSGKSLDYLACERLNYSYISIRASDWSCVEGNSKQSNNQKYPDRDSYTVIAA